MPRPLIVLVLLLLVLHQDNWLWTNDQRVLGFMPLGLFYHAGISLAAGIVWWLAVKFFWPVEIVQESAELTGDVCSPTAEERQ